MSSASRGSLALARRLAASEAARGKSSQRSKHGDATVRVCRRLGEVLAVYAGTTGVRSLLTRAVALAKEQEPALAPVRVGADGSLEGLETVSAGAAKGHVIVAHLLDLLIVFVGEPLMLELVREAWPDAPAPRSRTEGTP